MHQDDHYEPHDEPLFAMSTFEVGLACAVIGMAVGYLLAALPMILL